MSEPLATVSPPPPIVVLIGPAGSGKTAIGRRLAATLQVPFTDGDELHTSDSIDCMRSGLPLGELHRGPWLDRIRAELGAAAETGTGLVVACSALKVSYRSHLARELPAVRFVQLDADSDMLRARLERRRGHFFPATLLDSQLAIFEPLPAHQRVSAMGNPDATVTLVRKLLSANDAGRLIDGAALPVYDLGSDHPFARDRQQPLFDLLHTTELISAADLLACSPADDEQIATVHDRAYIRCLRATSAAQPDASALREARRFGLGHGDNPIAEGQYAAAAAVVGASLACVDAVLDGHCRAAFNPAGGLHHAMPHGAAGFCLFNDPAIAIRRARERGCQRVLYVDFDVHHGDGVERTFADDPSVLTISLHETPEVRYPGTGFVTDTGTGAGRGFALNVPLQPGTGDDSFLACAQRVLTAAFAGFRPDFVVSQHGCDTHRDDPLATLQCTTRTALAAAELVRTLADRHCGGRWVATGGGGYQPVTVIPRAWAMVWAAVARRPLPAALPEAWRQRWQTRAGGAMPEHWFDDDRPTPQEARAAEGNRRTVAALFREVPWLAADD